MTASLVMYMFTPNGDIVHPSYLTFVQAQARGLLYKAKQEHRIVYLVRDDRIDFLQARYHY